MVEVGNVTHEKIQKEPKRFTVIGEGQVFEKYWKPAMDRGIVKVSHVISLEDHIPAQDVDKYQYHKTGGV